MTTPNVCRTPGRRHGFVLALMAFVLCVTGLTACSSIALVPAGEHCLAGGLTVHSAIAWNRPLSRLLKKGSGEVWTGDGLMVDALILISGVEDGRPIFFMRQADRLRNAR